MRKTHAVVQVAVAWMTNACGRRLGYDLSKRSGVRSGVMYPILQRMLNQGWLVDGWEDQVQLEMIKRPPRRYYELTDEGKVALGALLSQVRRDARFRDVLTRRMAGVV